MAFLIDIQAKIEAGKGGGYARWAKVFNLKQMAQAMLFMEQKGISSYEELLAKTTGYTEKLDGLLESVKADEARLQEIAVLKKQIANYAKSRDTFAEYKKSGYSRDYFEKHRDVLTLRKAAKEAFDEYKRIHGKDVPIPKSKELSAEYTTVLERKKKNYAEYKKMKSEKQEWFIAKKIVQVIMQEEEQKQEEKQKQKEQNER